MDIIAALLIALGLRHTAPAVYHTPIKTIPLVIEPAPGVIEQWSWGPL